MNLILKKKLIKLFSEAVNQNIDHESGVLRPGAGGASLEALWNSCQFF